MRKMRRSVARSLFTIVSMSGYCTLTATRCPLDSRARWTWPIDADAIGRRSNDWNRSSGDLPPNSSRMRRSMSSYGRGGT